ncbi:MAG: DUF454 family protein [Alphaproteobacteria bacterium]|nr:DUF454 family protein [Alphaproteobacteria bacterium]
MQIAKQNKRVLLQVAGYLFFSIGFVGMLLPLLPTTVFWIIAAACFAKSAPDMYRRILSWPGVGPAISAYLERGVITRRSKTLALGGMGIGAFLIVASPLPPYIIAIPLLGLIFAATYVATRPGQPETVTNYDVKGAAIR